MKENNLATSKNKAFLTYAINEEFYTSHTHTSDYVEQNKKWGYKSVTFEKLVRIT